MGSMSIWHWLIVLVVVLLIFGTKKLRNIGQDLGGAVKGFKEGVKGAEDAADAAQGSRRAGGEDRRHDDRGRGQEGADAAGLNAGCRAPRPAPVRPAAATAQCSTSASARSWSSRSSR